MTSWELLPEPLLFQIFCWLNRKSVVVAGQVCSRWLAVSRDGLLWRRLLCKDYKLPYTYTTIRPGRTSWFDEYKRLVMDTPSILHQTLPNHRHEVLHVTFSHNGSQFSTCSKDGWLMVWDVSSTMEVSQKLEMNMTKKPYRWQYTWASKFNKSDSLLLVAGVLNEVVYDPEIIHTVNGELAIFNTSDYSIVCRVANNPYDVMGSWINDFTWVAGQIPTDINEMYAGVNLCRTHTSDGEFSTLDGEFPNNEVVRIRSGFYSGASYLRCLLMSNRQIVPPSQTGQDVFGPYQQFLNANDNIEMVDQEPDQVIQKLLCDNEYCLIFLCSSMTTIPHRIGFKRLYPQDLSRVPVVTNPDKIIELNGHIVGVHLAADGRHLFVNVRRWPEGAVPDDDDDPPPIATQIEMVVVDLATLSFLPTIYKGHKGFTDSLGAFYIYLDVSEDYVGSGSEDHSAKVWDRHYGCVLFREGLPHDRCVNCIAFSPLRNGLAVTVSDDRTVKVWKSRSLSKKIKELLATQEL